MQETFRSRVVGEELLASLQAEHPEIYKISFLLFPGS